MNIKEIQSKWKSDCKINPLKIEESILKNPILHSEYLELLSEAKISLFKSKKVLNKVKKIKQRYFKGLMSKEELKEMGWMQYQGNKPLKTEMNDLIETDDDYLEAIGEVQYYEICVEALESIMKNIHSRTFELKNIIEWRKFESGI